MMNPMFNNPEPPTPECKAICEYLKLFAFLTLVLGLVKLIGFGFGFNDLMLALVLYCGAVSINQCQVTFYVLFSFFSIVELVAAVGVLVQRGDNLLAKSNAAVTILCSISFVMYCVGKEMLRQGTICASRLTKYSNTYRRIT
jgi:hypothetical protein